MPGGFVFITHIFGKTPIRKTIFFEKKSPTKIKTLKMRKKQKHFWLYFFHLQTYDGLKVRNNYYFCLQEKVF